MRACKCRMTWFRVWPLQPCAAPWPPMWANMRMCMLGRVHVNGNGTHVLCSSLQRRFSPHCRAPVGFRLVSEQGRCSAGRWPSAKVRLLRSSAIRRARDTQVWQLLPRPIQLCRLLGPRVHRGGGAHLQATQNTPRRQRWSDFVGHGCASKHPGFASKHPGFASKHPGFASK